MLGNICPVCRKNYVKGIIAIIKSSTGIQIGSTNTQSRNQGKTCSAELSGNIMPAMRNKSIKIVVILTLFVCFLSFLDLIRTDGDSHLDRTDLLHQRYKQYLEFSERSSLNETLFAIALTKKDREIILSILKYIKSVCEQYRITYFITGGTLLGSWRHHGFIPWDDDIDIYVNIKDKRRLKHLLNAGTDEFYALLAYGRMKIFSENGTNTSDHPWLWPYVDVTFYLQNRTHIWGDQYDFPNEVYRREDVFPLHNRPFENLFVKSPHDGFAFLHQTFDNLNCETHFYNHKFESINEERVRSVRCFHFKNHLAFVYRQPTTDGSGIQETLVIGNETIHSLVVREPQYAITEPFSLNLLDARESSKNVPSIAEQKQRHQSNY